jgi:hypothetical protein
MDRPARDFSRNTAPSRGHARGAARLARAARCSAVWLLLWACNADRTRHDAVSAVPLRAPAQPLGLESAAAVEEDAPRRPAQPAEPPVRPELLAPGANEEFDAAALADVQQALSAVEESAFAPLVHGDKRVLPDSCRAWRAFRSRGFVPKSALAEQRDGGALVRCGGYEFLARAKPSRVSHVRKALEGAGPNGLPAILASATSKLALRARNVAVSKGLTLGEFLPDARAGKSELPGRVLIDEPASATSVIVNAEAWGDVNSDQVEDLLLSVLNSSEDVSYFRMRLIEVTRKSPDAPLQVLAVSE